MAKPHFYLKDKNSKSETLISLYLRVANRRFVYSTGHQVRPSLWSFSKERVLGRHPNASAINSKLDMLAREVINQYESIQRQKGFVNWSDLRKALDIETGKVKGSVSLMEFFDQYIEEKRASPQFQAQSLGTYTSARTKLKQFARYKRQDVDFQDLDYAMWSELENFMLDQGLSNNYAHKLLTRIKTVLTQAIKRKVNTNLDHQHLDIGVNTEASTSIYLNENELIKLVELDLSKNLKLDRVRDLFILGARTGLRYSDFIRLSRDSLREIDGLMFIDFLTKKTKKKVIIPVHPDVQNIFQKYDKLPSISQQKMNDYLKEIGKLTGFMDDTVNWVRTTGGRTVSKRIPRHELFTTHTARRSFATNAYKAGWDLVSIMMITGHTTQQQLLKYIKVTEEENAMRIAQKTTYNIKEDINALQRIINNSDRLGLSSEQVQSLQEIQRKISQAE